MAIPQRGLGFANPAAKRAMMLAALNGSTALPMPGAMPPGQPAPPPMEPQPSPGAAPPTPAPLPMPNMPMVGPGGRPSPEDVAQLPVNIPQVGPGTDPAAPPPAPGAPPASDPEGKTPKWARIAGAIGHVLLSADAGYRGQPLPKYEDPAERERQEAQQQAEFLINTTARMWEIMRNAPPDKRDAMMAQFEAALQKVNPDFDFRGMMESLETDADKVDKVAPQIAMMSPEAKQMFMAALSARGGDAEAAAALLKDETFMKSLIDFEDSRNAPVVRYKLAAIQKAMDSLGLTPDQMADLTPENFEVLNAQLPEQYRLTPSEIATLRRRPEMGAGLGMQTPKTKPDQTLNSRAGVPEEPEDAPPEPVADASSPPKPQRPPAPSPSSGAPPRRPQGKPTRSAKAPPPTRPKPGAPPAEGSGDDDPNYAPPGAGPVYTRKGWQPDLADPAVQRDLKKLARERGLTREQVEAAIAEAGERAGKPPLKRGKAERPTAPPPERPKAKGTQKFKAPRDMTIPGVGPVKKGDVVTYDPATGKYTRG